MNTPRQELLEVLGHLSLMYPDLRFGQLLITVSNWAKHQPDSLWDATDEELLAAVTAHLERTGALEVSA